MNDSERREWVMNDEGLYRLWQRSGAGLYRWVRENRQFIDDVTSKVASGERRPSFLVYG